MKNYDVIIIGAGPAGIASAKVLEDNNINFCIIEKNKFPREKLCGGGLTHKSIKLLKKLNLSLDGLDYIKIKEVSLFAKNIESKIPLTHEMYMTERKMFDYNIFKQIKKSNIFNENIINVENNILTTDKNVYSFKYIIFADGVNGYSKNLIDNRKLGFCVECNINNLTNIGVIDFCNVESGYGWIFPKNNHTTIGIGASNDKKIDYIDLLIKFAKKHNFVINKEIIKGCHIPIYSNKVYKKSVIDNKYILVGDAASLVDPVSGEGIYYALLSGKKAAESILKCLNKKKKVKYIYFRKSISIYLNLNIRKFMSKLLYSKYSTFFIKLGLLNKLNIKILNLFFG